MEDYFDEMYKAITDFHPQGIKPLYMLIKVDVDPEVVYNMPKAHTYAESHCNKMEYELVDYFYPNDDHHHSEHPFIKL